MKTSSFSMPRLGGVWVPLITPFAQDKLDEASLARLVRHYSKANVTGFILAGTTGESMALDEAETRQLVDVVQHANTQKLPVFLGHTGSNTKKLAHEVARTNAWPVDGYLIATPYFTRPSQEGLYQHFSHVAQETSLPIIVYNIPYRTGVNMANETLFRLAEHSNIVGVKDCCANEEQTQQLICQRPSDFSVLVGDDANFFKYVKLGADGGILASAHIAPQGFATVLHGLRQGQPAQAQTIWDSFADVIPMLFAEPNPCPLKYILHQQGLIASPEARLPMLPISKSLEAKLNARLAAPRALTFEAA